MELGSPPVSRPLAPLGRVLTLTIRDSVIAEFQGSVTSAPVSNLWTNRSMLVPWTHKLPLPTLPQLHQVPGSLGI